jgi:transposase
MILVAGGGEYPEPKPHKMKAKRRRHEPEFKARVALEALKGIETIQQIAKNFDIHPVQVSEWKKAMTEGAIGVFGPGREKAETEGFERERDQLHAKIGQLTIEVDFLRKKSKQLGL